MTSSPTATTTTCPSWCSSHRTDDGVLVHRHRITHRDDPSVTVEVTETGERRVVVDIPDNMLTATEAQIIGTVIAAGGRLLDQG